MSWKVEFVIVVMVGIAFGLAIGDAFAENLLR